jgi:HPt (histidine-containing phosphotransfer) domain-containing protein
MIIYNHKLEFVGIDDKDLRSIGYKNLLEMQSECSDFADLFVNRPNYIHNFKNFSWIYFVLNSDFPEAKVIIAAKGREFSATLEINSFYLNDTPDKEAFSVTLTKLKALDGKEIELTKREIVVPQSKPVVPELHVPQKPLLAPEIHEELIPDLTQESSVILSEPDPLDIPSNDHVIEDPYDFDFSAPLEIEDVYVPHEMMDHASLLEYEEEDKHIIPEVENKSVEDIKNRPMLGDYIHTSPEDNIYVNALHTSKDYVYDPRIASEELGLPVDLIEEFIGDFIQQSYDFKTELYNHLAKEELDDVKVLSHKLKGVAANLRIEDAFEVLTLINTSSDLKEILATMDHFYAIIAKLAKTEPTLEASQSSAQEISHSLENSKISDEDKPLEVTSDLDDIYSFDFDEEESIPEKRIDPLEYNTTKAVNELGLPAELIDELLQDFKEQATLLLKDIETAVSTMHRGSLRSLLMNIKGTSDNLRVMKISQLLEIFLTSTDQEELQELLERLKNYLAQI